MTDYTQYSNLWHLTGGTAIPANADIDTYFEAGNYGVMSSADARTMTGLPFAKGNTNNYAFNLKVENSALNDPNARRQILQFFNDRQRWIRYGTKNNTTWNDWEREPTRSEIDALNNSIAKAMSIYTGFQSSQIVGYDDGRIQLKFFKSDGKTVYVLTIYESTGMILTKSTDNQSTFTELWRITP